MNNRRDERRPRGRGTGASRNYSPLTLKLLWGRAAGHCAMPDCRVELFADATDYDPVVPSATWHTLPAPVMTARGRRMNWL